HSGVLSQIRERDAVNRIVRVVLFRIVLARLTETNGRKALEVPCRVIAAAADAIAPRHQAHPMRWDVPRGRALDEHGERSRWRIVRPVGVQTNRRPISGTVAAHRTA